jgi:hypothetical protein
MSFHLADADTKSNPMKKAITAVHQMMYNWEFRDLWTQMSLHPSAPLHHDD